MSLNDEGIFSRIKYILQQDYRGVNIAVYALATTGFCVAVHKIRPVSKFSKATKVPNHFIQNHVPLQGTFVGIKHLPVRLLVDHKAPIYLPFWHSSKPPLPVKLWGVDVVSGNAVSWLDCVAKNKKVTLKPIARDNEDLVSTVLVHLPQQTGKTSEAIDIGKRLVELGFAKASLPSKIPKNSFESKLLPDILSAEDKAKSYRNGIWSDILPPIPFYVVYLRKSGQLFLQLLIVSAKKLLQVAFFTSKGALVGVKNLAKKGLTMKKRVQAT